MREELRGVVDSIVFQSSDNNFCVFRLLIGETRVPVVISGLAPLLGEEVSLAGQWTEHTKFGRQFKALSYNSTTETSKGGIERFLGSGVIKGVGRSMAARIVAHFGLDSLRIMSQEPARLMEISGIGAKKAEAIFASYSELSEIRELMLFLEEHGISANYAAKLQNAYGAAAIELLKSDPYRLAYDIEGIGFQIADRIARVLGFAANDRRRLRGGTEFALQKIAQSGHVCVPQEFLAKQAAELLGVNIPEISEILEEMLATGLLRTEQMGGQCLVYPEYLYRAEVETARRLLRLQNKTRALTLNDADEIIDKWESLAGIKLATVQRTAIGNVLDHGVLVVSGGPGTGKTTLIRGIISVMAAAGSTILLAAPTGRAARRLAESAGRSAHTVHKLLEYQPREGRFAFGRNEENPVEADAVIVDEASMLDINLTAFLLKALPDGCRLILVGDVDQLPAIGPGNVLKDIIKSQKVPVVRLNEVFRQAQESRIVLNAHKINRGLMPESDRAEEFSLVECADEAAVADVILELYGALPCGAKNIQVLTPMHKLACGVENLNRLLQEKTNPPDPGRQEIHTPRQILREGDRIMQIRNNYEKEVFNGDLGWVSGIAGRTLTAHFPDINDGLSVQYEAGELDELQLAYAMSVHKSQ